MIQAHRMLSRPLHCCKCHLPQLPGGACHLQGKGPKGVEPKPVSFKQALPPAKQTRHAAPAEPLACTEHVAAPATCLPLCPLFDASSVSFIKSCQPCSGTQSCGFLRGCASSDRLPLRKKSRNCTRAEQSNLRHLNGCAENAVCRLNTRVVMSCCDCLPRTFSHLLCTDWLLCDAQNSLADKAMQQGPKTSHTCQVRHRHLLSTVPEAPKALALPPGS